MTDLGTKFHIEVIKEARKHKISVLEVSNVYFDAYKTHKTEHGSYRDVENRQAKMNDRYRFMRDKALDYIHQKVEQRTRHGNTEKR